MTRLLTTMALIGATALTSGCATLLASGPSRVDVRVEGPAQAAVTLHGVENGEVIHKGTGTFEVTLDRYASYALLATAEGYEPRLVKVRSDYLPVYYLNMVPYALGLVGSALAPNVPGLLLGSATVTLAGSLIDDWTKSGRRHETQSVVIRLTPKPAAPAR